MDHKHANSSKTLGLFVVISLVALWVWGILLAQGFWNTILALLPPVAWLFVIEFLLRDSQLLSFLH